MNISNVTKEKLKLTLQETLFIAFI